MALSSRRPSLRWSRAWSAGALAVAAVVTPVAVSAPTAYAAAVTYYRPADGVLHLAGHGYGHAHGMSQWGAYGGAESGKTYRQILDWYYASPALGTAGGAIKVQITSDGRGSDGRYDTQVKPVAGLTAVDSGGHTLALPAAASNGTAFDLYRAVLLSDGSLRVQGREPSGWLSLAPTGGTVATWTGWVRFTASGGVLDLVRSGGSTQLYREALELDPTSGSAGITVNRLSLEHYLAGVVSSEMPCGWTPTVAGSKRLDALEAQAVAARSYAAWRREHPRSSLADIVDNTGDQAYHGYSAEKSALSDCPWTGSGGAKTSAEVAAITATAGQVMVDAGEHPIFAQYSASNGGFETSGSQPYLPSRPDAWDGVPTESWSSHSWTDTVTAGQIESTFPGVGRLASVTVAAREALSGTDQNGHQVGEQWGGRITSLTLSGSGGSVTTTGASFAAAIGLRSPWFAVVVTRPAAPGSVSASPGDAQATVRWTAPASDGGGGIRSYTITATPSIPAVTVSAGARSAVVTGLSNDTPYTFSVRAANTAGSGAGKAAAPVVPSARVVFHPLRPTRILDTRSTGGALGPGVTRAVRVTGVGGVPASGAVDVALDVVSIDPSAASSLAVFPHGGARPADPQLTWAKASRVNALVLVKVGRSGLVDVRNAAGTTRLFVDVQGYYTAATGAGDVLTATTSTRLYDSRSVGPVPAGASRTVQVVGKAGVPAGATAAVLQLTAARPARRDYVRAWAGGTSPPAAYDLYAPAGRYTDATAIVPLTGSGAVVVSPAYATNLVVTLVGFFTTSSSPTSGVTSLLTPTHRVLRATVPARTTVAVSTGAPSTAGAAVVSLTATGAAGTLVSVYRFGSTSPATATMHLAGSASSITVSVPLGPGGKVSVRNPGRAAVQVVLDVVAWSAN